PCPSSVRLRSARYLPTRPGGRRNAAISALLVFEALDNDYVYMGAQPERRSRLARLPNLAS
ncbi:MAG: hypothetical protein M3283_12375, partial [Actinomycetota bacterium]|nr:hypothetical protein [Actinomycetota bacterium]